MTTIQIPAHFQGDYRALRAAHAPLEKMVESKKFPGFTRLVVTYFGSLTVAALLFFLLPKTIDHDGIRAGFSVLGTFAAMATLGLGSTHWSDEVLPNWRRKQHDRWIVPESLYRTEEKLWQRLVSRHLEESGEGQLATTLYNARGLSCDIAQAQEVDRWIAEKKQLKANEEARYQEHERRRARRRQESGDRYYSIPDYYNYQNDHYLERQARDNHEQRIQRIHDRRYGTLDSANDSDFESQLYLVRPDGSYHKAEIVDSGDQVTIEVADSRTLATA